MDKFICVTNEQLAEMLIKRGYNWIQRQTVGDVEVFLFPNDEKVIEIATSKFAKNAYFFSNKLYM